MTTEKFIARLDLNQIFLFLDGHYLGSWTREWTDRTPKERFLSFVPGKKPSSPGGYSETERIRDVLRLGAFRYSKKPCTIENIGTAIRWALDA